MDNKALIPLFNSDKLLELMQALRAMSTNKARIIESRINKKPHCNVLTSIARLLSAQEVCGCFHLKDDQLFLSTNKETRKGEFRNEVGKLIVQLIQNGFKEEDKLALYRKCFPYAIKGYAKPYKDEFASIPSFVSYVDQQEQWNNISLLEIETLQRDLQQFLENNRGNQRYTTACIRLLIPLDDISRICNELSGSEHTRTRALILNQPLFSNRHNSVNDIHCELAALERDSKDHNFEELISQISKRAKNKEFTISKFCCYLCYQAFHTFGKVSCLQGIEFDCLGNSGTVFPRYKNPSFQDTPFVQKAAKELDNTIQELIDTIKNKREYILQTAESLENSTVGCYQHSSLESSHMEEKMAGPTLR